MFKIKPAILQLQQQFSQQKCTSQSQKGNFRGKKTGKNGNFEAKKEILEAKWQKGVLFWYLLSPACWSISAVQTSSSIKSPSRFGSFSQFRLLIFLFWIGPKHTLRLRCFLPTLTQGSQSAQSPQTKPPVTLPLPASVTPSCDSKNIKFDVLIEEKSG